MPIDEELRIEPAAAEDIPVLAELLALLFAIERDFAPAADRQRRGIELLLLQPDTRAAVLVGRRGDGRAIGMVSAQLVISTAEGAASAWIEDVVVHPDYRGRGLGGRLLRAALDWAARQGATRAQLLADRTNRAALGMYRHLGWRSTRLGAWRVPLSDRA
ncbi:MAG TPA: GNAT family N-acetyltransferase [Burkholderiales bacterium]|nr:GNAT family N-acetyltransferase [Burkholderiales bacterium]